MSGAGLPPLLAGSWIDVRPPALGYRPRVLQRWWDAAGRIVEVMLVADCRPEAVAALGQGASADPCGQRQSLLYHVSPGGVATLVHDSDAGDPSTEPSASPEPYREVWDLTPDPDIPFDLVCEVRGVTQTEQLCLLAARQLVADEEAAHPGRDVYDVRIDRDGVVMCWWETASPAPSGSPEPEPGCTELTIELEVPVARG
jgi:hypothetical protein